MAPPLPNLPLIPNSDFQSAFALAQEQAQSELQTLRDLIRYATTWLTRAEVSFGQGVVDAHDEAVWLVLRGLRLPPDQLEPFLEAKVLHSERMLLLSLLQRRIVERVPMAYLLGEAWQQGVRFRSDPRALIPRSLIAELLADGLSAWVDDDAVESVLDLCTGSGCLAILAALRWPQAEVLGLDLSDSALDLARENVVDHALQDRVLLQQSDLMSVLPSEQRFDLILCNPPYVNAQSMAHLPAEFRHEPELALAAGQDGMDLIRRILPQASQHLKPSGVLVLELGHERPFFEQAFPQLPVQWLDTSVPGSVLLIEASDLQQVDAS